MYNCEKQISRVLAKFDTETQKILAEILVVDNGSKDNGLQVAKDSLAKLSDIKTTLVQNSDNYSLGGSHKVAFNYAIEKGYDYVVVLHGDDQGSIQDLLPYIQSGEYQNFDSMLGARFALGSKLIGYSWFRTFGNYALNLLCSIAAGYWISDMGSGLNIYKTSYLKNKFYLFFQNDLTFNVFMVFYGCHVKSKFKFFPLTWSEDDQISNAKIFKQALRILGLLFEYIFSRKQLFSFEANQFSTINYSCKVQFSSEANHAI
ncbi:MAG: glycosyltransferase family 2 protein [Candidatus Caenarcaniphilales bacterium]|jgi:glycosyltransferase involved in cell wall biosynthesis|nr:glycosyltransferase family 2 protein [Candidatus Caenarcaniphilales bacterium]